MDFDELSTKIIGAALRVHTALGAGLFEEVYKVCLKYELEQMRLKVDAEVGLPVTYKGVQLDLAYRIDLMIEDELIVELKAVQQLAPFHKAQLLTYLKLAKKEVGLLLNFNTTHLREGIVRVVNSTAPSR